MDTNLFLFRIFIKKYYYSYFMCPSSFNCAATALRDNVSLTWGTHSEWECDRTDGKLWDTCRNRAAPLRSDRRRTSPRWDLPPAPVSFQTLAALRTEDVAPSLLWTLIQGPALGRAPWAAVEALTGPRCCCPAGWSLHWTGPAGRGNTGYDTPTQ